MTIFTAVCDTSLLKNRMFVSVILMSTLIMAACNASVPSPPSATTPEVTTAYPAAKTIGSIKIWDDSLSEIIASDAVIEVLAEGFQWSEGPAWDKKRQRVYFSDVPQNKVHIWSDMNGLQTFLDPSGIPNDQANGFREPGSNGLLVMPNGKLLIANHGKRALELMDLDTQDRTLLMGEYQGKSLNSPNDIVLAKDGTLYFTDPPYGLEGLDASPLKELDFNGVYKLAIDGTLSVIDSTQTFPNGIALSPDEQFLYVAVSDLKTPKIMRYSKNTEGEFDKGQIWFDAKPYQEEGLPGLPDGMVVAESGHIFATGPGGVFILSPEGKPLGQIRTDRATGNCTFGDDGKTLYITAGNSLVSVRLLQGATL